MKIIQKKILVGTKIIELSDEKVRLAFKSLTNRNEEYINLFDLNSQYDKYRHRPYKFLIVGILLSIPGVPFFIESITAWDLVPLFVSSIFLLPGLGCIVAYVYQQSDNIIFRYRHNDSVAFNIWNNKPNKKELEQFLEEFSKKIEKTKFHPETSSEQKIEAYKNAIEFLFHEEIITEAEAKKIFIKAKNKALDIKQGEIVRIK